MPGTDPGGLCPPYPTLTDGQVTVRSPQPDSTSGEECRLLHCVRGLVLRRMLGPSGPITATFEEGRHRS